MIGQSNDPRSSITAKGADRHGTMLAGLAKEYRDAAEFVTANPTAKIINAW